MGGGDEGEDTLQCEELQNLEVKINNLKWKQTDRKAVV